jgi:predicted Zn-dependent protease
MQRIQTFFIALALTLLANSAAAFVVSEKEVKRQFRVEWLSMKRHVPLESEPVQRYAECIAQKLIAQLPPEHAHADWEILVFDDEQIQAFADPNYKIGIFSGLLKVADTPDALAAVVGHEIAHVTEGHVMSRARKNARQEVWATLGGAATGAPDYWRQGLAIGFGFPFVREQETESDLVGLDYMAKAGFDPRAAVYLWKNMAAAKAALGREEPPEFLSTHPSDSVRTDDMIKSLTPALIEYNAAREAGRRPACTIAR